MALFWKYLKQKRKIILIQIVFFMLFFISYMLYHLPVSAALYPIVLCLIMGVLLLIYDFIHFRQKHLRLAEMQHLTAELMADLPVAATIEENDYQEIIYALREEQQQMLNHMDMRYQDMIDYYTVWVHQIKTPIASMRLTLQNEDSELSRKVAGDLFRIEQYVEMVLCYLRLDEGSTDYVIREYDLDKIVRQAVKKFAGQFISKKIRLDYQALKASVITDEKWLLFVLEQVLSNALKYTEAGTITITMENQQTLCIRDTGIGITSEDLPRIFERGYTGYNGRADKKGEWYRIVSVQAYLSESGSWYQCGI